MKSREERLTLPTIIQGSSYMTAFQSAAKTQLSGRCRNWEVRTHQLSHYGLASLVKRERTVIGQPCESVLAMDADWLSKARARFPRNSDKAAVQHNTNILLE